MKPISAEKQLRKKGATWPLSWFVVEYLLFVLRSILPVFFAFPSSMVVLYL